MAFFSSRNFSLVQLVATRRSKKGDRPTSDYGTYVVVPPRFRPICDACCSFRARAVVPSCCRSVVPSRRRAVTLQKRHFMPFCCCHCGLTPTTLATHCSSATDDGHHKVIEALALQHGVIYNLLSLFPIALSPLLNFPLALLSLKLSQRAGVVNYSILPDAEQQ